MKRSTPLARLAGMVMWLAITLGAGAIGAVASRDADVFYGALELPAWAPPSSVFGPVWTALYVLMGVAAWMVWREGELPHARRALGIFVVQLVLNTIWSWLFFRWHLGLLSFVDICVLWLLIVATMVAFWRIQPFAGVLLLPYLIWVSFAAALNLVVWRMNPAALG